MTEQTGQTAQLTVMPREVELAAAGAMILSPANIDRVHEWLDAEDFVDPTARTLYETARDLHLREEHVDQATVLAELHRSRATLRDPYLGPTLAQLDSAVPAPVQGPHYCRLVLEASVRREVEAAGIRLQQTATQAAGRPDEVLALADQHADGIAAAALRWQAAQDNGRAPVALSPEAEADAATRGPVDYQLGKVVPIEELETASPERIAAALDSLGTATDEAAAAPGGDPERAQAAFEAFSETLDQRTAEGRTVTVGELARLEARAHRDLDETQAPVATAGVSV